MGTAEATAQTAAEEIVEETTDDISVDETAEGTEESAVVGEGEHADDETPGSLATSVLLGADVHGDICTTVVVAFCVVSTDETIVGTNEGLLW